VKFLIVGAGQTGRLVAEIVGRIPRLECVGFIDRDVALHGRQFYGVPVLGGEDRLEQMAGGEVEGALPVFGDLAARLRVFRRCRALRYQLVNVIEPSVVAASDVHLGEGIFISFGAKILTAVEIGDFALIGTGVNILHDSTIGPNCVIGGGSTIGASVTVGRNVSFGVGVQVASGRIRIGNDVRVAAGSVILRDVPDNAFVLGNPARVIGHNPPAEAS
jgi:sugar O-acyltransferase (sialic acid O-acetyltransferase NeuD family)